MMYCDVFGVGAGPSNLSLAALLEKIPNIKAYFCDKKLNYQWHPGMLIPGTKLQVSYLKDLVTLADPMNQYSFINYLHQSGKLYQFITADFKQTSRLEFSQYLEWVFNNLGSVHEGEMILDISLIEDQFSIRTTKEIYQSKKLVLGNGLTPYIPAYCIDFMGDRVFHSAEYLHKKTNLSNKRIAIIGGGQSGAEILLDSLSNANGLPSKIHWVSKEQNFDVIDDSAFANELFLPSYVKYFFKLPQDIKSSLLEKQRLASDGISNHTIDSIYQKLYELELVHKHNRLVTLLPSHKLTLMSSHNNEYLLEIFDNETGFQKNIAADLVIFCTGYTYMLPSFLNPIKEKIHFDSTNKMMIDENYKLSWDGMDECSIYIQNGARHSHGVADPNLSLLAYRSAVIANDIAGYPLYSHINGTSLVSWGTLND